MASTQATKILEDLCDAEGGSQTIANFRAYYQAYLTEEGRNGAVNYETYLAVIESYMRNSGLAGA